MEFAPDGDGLLIIDCRIAPGVPPGTAEHYCRHRDVYGAGANGVGLGLKEDVLTLHLHQVFIFSQALFQRF